MDSRMTNYPNGTYPNGMYPNGGRNPKKPNNQQRTVIIVCLAAGLSVLLLVASILLYITMKENRRIAATPPVLVVTSCPEQIQSTAPDVTIAGTMFDKYGACTLKINGETVDAAMDAGVTKTWSKTYTLTAGETKTFSIVLENYRGNKTELTKQVFCQSVTEVPKAPTATATATPEPTTPLTNGSQFVKKKSKGLNIREYAGTEYDVVYTIPSNDYTSRMTFTGYYETDYYGYTWYEVVAPNGMMGWVRSDLVKRVS